MAKLYVAYGSNLNKEQMRYRCPTAKFVGTGIIEGYELQFKGSASWRLRYHRAKGRRCCSGGDLDDPEAGRKTFGSL